MTEDKDKEREKILQFARQKFQNQGFYKTSMDEISSELRVSKKTVYKYFESKEQLVHDIVIDALENDQCLIDEVINSDDNVIIKFVRIINFMQIRFNEFSENWLKDLQIHTPHLWERIDNFRVDKINKGMRFLIEQGKKEKFIENYDPSLIISSMISSIRTVIRPDFLSVNKLTIVDAYIQTFDMLLNGILTEKGKTLYSKEKKKLKLNLKQNLNSERENYV